jgi:hypothetical protein
MVTIIWIAAGIVSALFIGTVIKDYFQTKADKREVMRRDIEYKLKKETNR